MRWFHEEPLSRTPLALAIASLATFGIGFRLLPRFTDDPRPHPFAALGLLLMAAGFAGGIAAAALAAMRFRRARSKTPYVVAFLLGLGLEWVALCGTLLRALS